MINAMQKELYFDIGSAEKGGSLFRIKSTDGAISFYYNHSTYDSDRDELKVFEDNYPDFNAFWNEFTQDREWFYFHPLYVHPEQRDFVQEKLRMVDWNVQSNKKWQESHQRQWKKVLSDPAGYYNSP
jgi:hypothetical protein